jgi:hypothetical protein
MANGEGWIRNKWRPMMAWMYMVVCFFDFIVFPAGWSWYQGSLGQTLTQWQPLTLNSAAFFHLAMGAVIGVATWKRTEEKLADKV